MEIKPSRLFINSEQVGEKVSIRLPGFKGEGEETFIHYLESGIGEPLILVHGIGQSLYTWRNVFAELSENYRVIAIDLPGHGYSGRPESLNYSMDSMADVLRAFMDAKGLESAHMIGFSTGAMYVLRFLSLYEDRVANCVVIAPGGITDRMPALVRRIGRPFRSVFARNLFTANDVRKLLYECFYDEDKVDDKVVRQYYQPVSDGLSREALMYAIRNFDMDTVAEGLVDLDHEILVLWGKEDDWHPPVGSVYFQNVLRSGRYYLIKRTGHLVQEENPDKFLDVILSYIPPTDPGYRAYDFKESVGGHGIDPEMIPEGGIPIHADPAAYEEDTKVEPLEGFSDEAITRCVVSVCDAVTNHEDNAPAEEENNSDTSEETQV